MTSVWCGRRLAEPEGHRPSGTWENDVLGARTPWLFVAVRRRHGRRRGPSLAARARRTTSWRDGGTLVYRAGTRLFAVDVTSGPEVTALALRLLLERPDFLTRAGDVFRNWEVHPDGTRLLMVGAAARDASGAPRSTS